jgi:D-threonine aldolase
LVMHSEEHLVLETERAGEFEVGAVLYGIPWHICPTVALHSHATVVRQGRAIDCWSIEARNRKLTV